MSSNWNEYTSFIYWIISLDTYFIFFLFKTVEWYWNGFSGLYRLFLSSLITVWFDDSKQPIKKIMCHIFMCLLWIDNCARWTSSLFNILLPTIKDVCWQLFTRWLKFLTSIDGILLDRNKICAHVFYNNKHLIGGNI